MKIKSIKVDSGWTKPIKCNITIEQVSDFETHINGDIVHMLESELLKTLSDDGLDCEEYYCIKKDKDLKVDETYFVFSTTISNKDVKIVFKNENEKHELITFFQDMEEFDKYLISIIESRKRKIEKIKNGK